MLKIKTIERHRPTSKILSLLNTIPNIDLKIINGYTVQIEKTNIKQIFPIVYIINNKLTIYEFSNLDKKKSYYVVEHNKTYSLDELINVL